MKSPDPDTRLTRAPRRTVALLPKRVLIYLDDLHVEEDGPRVIGDVAQVVGHEERRREDSPEGELRLLLGLREPEVSDHQHVRVVPVPGACGGQHLVAGAL